MSSRGDDSSESWLSVIHAIWLLVFKNILVGAEGKRSNGKEMEWIGREEWIGKER